MHIELLGSIDDGVHFTDADIRATLNCPVALEHNGMFTGRPATGLFVNDIFVLKIRNDFIFQYHDAGRRAMSALTRERDVAVHHPYKSWFTIEDDAGKRIGNIAPRLTPLYNPLGDNDAIPGLKRLLALYLSTAASHSIRLDEGLSNFGSNKEGKLFYVDDDLYAWDGFTSLSQSLGNWIRRLPHITPEHWKDFGDTIFHQFLDAFGSLHPVDIFLGQLRNCIYINAVEEEKLRALTGAVQNLRRGNRQRSAIVKEQTPAPEQLPPRFGILADIHGNGPALKACLTALRERNIDRFLILGDIVGYGPHPKYCVDSVRELPAIIIQGNHDYAIASGDLSRGFSELARWAAIWTCEQLDEDYCRWLAQLEPVYRQEDWMAVHGAPIDKNYFLGYVYEMTYQDNLEWLQKEKIRLAFHGHSHIPKVYTRVGQIDGEMSEETVPLTHVDCALLCPGSVGQPRLGQTPAECAIYDGTTKQFDFLQVEYEIEKTAEDMRQLTFPDKLVDRLLAGK